MQTYTLELLGKIYTYRPVTRGEAMRILQSAVITIDAEDGLVDLCVSQVYDIATGLTSPGNEVDWPSELGGIATQLADAIREVSGMSQTSAERFKQQAQEWILSPMGRSEMLMQAFLHISLEEIHAMAPEYWYYAATAAETLAEMMQKLNQPQGAHAPQQRPPDARPAGRREKQIVSEGEFAFSR